MAKQWLAFVDKYKGSLSLFLGAILLIYSLNIFGIGEWLNGVFTLIALSFLVYGIIETGLWDRIAKAIKQDGPTLKSDQ